MTLPTRGETYSQLCEYLRKAQETAATMAHLHNAEGLRGNLTAKGWLGISELLKRMIHQVTELAKAGLQ